MYLEGLAGIPEICRARFSVLSPTEGNEAAPSFLDNSSVGSASKLTLSVGFRLPLPLTKKHQESSSRCLLCPSSVSTFLNMICFQEKQESDNRAVSSAVR